MPAVSEYIQKEFGGDFELAVTTLAIGTTVGQVVPNNFDRMALLVINIGAADVYMGPSGSVAAGQGIFLAANGGTFSSSVVEDGPLPAYDFDAIANAGGSTLYIIETKRYG